MALTETQLAPNESNTFSQRRSGVVTQTPESSPQGQGWQNYEKVLFRFFFLYFALQIVPLDWRYYRDIFSLDWSSLHFSNFFYLARYSPRLFSEVPVLLDWLVIAGAALIGTVTWGIVDRKNIAYDTLYYWLRAGLRYRLALALLAYGFIKFFPMQMPEPSLSNLNTNYGDITNWKVFSMSTGIVPGYETFLGLVEISAALLLLNRRTASIGAFIILPFTGNVVMSNLAYEGGEYVYGLLLVSFAIAVIAYDLPRLISLASERPTLPARFKPVFDNDLLKNGRIIAKSLFIGFVVLYGYLTYESYTEDIYQYPKEKGLADASGIYNVSTFKINGEERSYSPNDDVRWKDVVFEKWATLSIRSNAPVQITTATTEEIFRNDEDRVYELAGIAGRHYYSYQIDSVKQKLLLKNRNSNHGDDSLELSYERVSGDQLILSGVNSNNDSLYVVLDRIPKKYLLEEATKNGRRRGLKL
jgi:hypothetical protein